MRLTRTIAFRLFLLIASVATIILATFTVVSIRIQRADAMEHIMLSATRISDVIARSTRHSMMLNQKEDVQNIVKSVGGQQGIEDIRIYNKQGAIVFSTVETALHTQADMSAEACITCHAGGKLEVVHPETEDLSRIFTGPDRTRILGLITPIKNEPECSNAACHAHPSEKTILGVLDVKMSLASIDQRIEESTNKLIILSVAAVLIVSLISGGFIRSVVYKPVRKLIAAMRHAAGGGFDQKIEVQAQNEIGELAEQFNAMTADLAAAREEITAWSATLEQKVQQKSKELERAHGHLLQVEKMVSLGNLAASVAHELNNPLEGILTFSRLLIKQVRKSPLPPEQIASLTEDLTLVADESLRCGNIVKNLLLFARNKETTFQQANLAPIIDRCVKLTGHHAKVHGVRTEVEVPGDLTLECNPNEMEQVLIALTVNAIEAMSGSGNPGGRVHIAAMKPNDDEVLLKVSDTGIGMSDEIREHIFEPFFTTKSNEKGVGLGLAVAYGIIQRHHGTIHVESAPGKGTTFTITLPVIQPAPATPESVHA